jgi:hypothetical protein
VRKSCQCLCITPHSSGYLTLKEIIGFSLVARCAGIQQASQTTIANNDGTAVKVTGSVAVTPSNKTGMTLGWLLIEGYDDVMM